MKAPVRIAVGSFHSGELRDVEFFVKRGKSGRFRLHRP